MTLPISTVEPRRAELRHRECWRNDGKQKFKRWCERKAGSVDEERNGVNVWENVFLWKRRGKLWLRGLILSQFFLHRLYLLWLLSTLSPSWLMPPSQPSQVSLKTWRRKCIVVRMIHIQFLFVIAPSFTLVLVLIAWDKRFWDSWWN